MRNRQRTGSGGIRVDWRGLAPLFFLLPILIGLGVWQLQRADEKRAMLTESVQLRERAPVPLQRVDQPRDYLPVQLRGRFDAERYWLLDNRIHRGRFGYQVVSLFELASGRQVLVNRGWVPGDPGRRSLPEIDTPAGGVTALGEIYHDRAGAFRLAEGGAAQGWPRRVQWLNIDAVREEFGRDLYPFTVRLYEGEPGAFTVDHPVVNVQPQRHIAYAIQWFGIALVAAVFFLARYTNVFRRRNEQDGVQE